MKAQPRVEFVRQFAERPVEHERVSKRLASPRQPPG